MRRRISNYKCIEVMSRISKICDRADKMPEISSYIREKVVSHKKYKCLKKDSRKHNNMFITGVHKAKKVTNCSKTNKTNSDLCMKGE